MFCKCNRNCCGCKELIYTGTVASTASNVTITLPSQSVCNNECLCFVVTTSIPVTTNPLPVQIIVGTTTYNMINNCSNAVYSDQIKSRKVYCVSLKTDTLLAKNMKCNLCPTSVDIPCLPATTSVVSETAISLKGVGTK